eukprot:m.64831 g.64831  ORF g.64831 m.64831 type:complete len:69 (+) comp13511_c0_seq2:1623-1829(+)
MRQFNHQRRDVTVGYDYTLAIEVSKGSNWTHPLSFVAVVQCLEQSSHESLLTRGLRGDFGEVLPLRPA